MALIEDISAALVLVIRFPPLKLGCPKAAAELLRF
jgi:hypothetical protein